MFGEKSLLQQYRDERLRRKGVALAQEEIRQFEWKNTLESIREERKRQFCLYDGDLHGAPFRTGWMSIWIQLGSQDAELGICRYDYFQNEWYDSGWWQQVESRRKYGWKNLQLETLLDQVIAHWKKLKAPNSDNV